MSIYRTILVLLLAISSFAQVDWTWRNPLPQGNELSSITNGNGQYVTVGRNGTILTSLNGITWSLRSSGTTSWLYSITYGNNQYVAVGSSGAILTSSDGIVWTWANNQMSASC
jgi:hypothetical protein